MSDGDEASLHRLDAADEGLRARGKRQRRQRILDAARELLHEDPDQGLTVPRIAERADVSPATVFNLVGPRERIWAALADHALGAVDYSSLPSEDPHERARAIVAGVAQVVSADAPVFRALIAGWSESGRAMAHDPTGELAACLHAAARDGLIMPDLNIKRLAELMSAGLIGTVHQWAAGLISDRAMSIRLQDLVDVTFAAARPSPAGERPHWKLDAAPRATKHIRETRNPA